MIGEMKMKEKRLFDHRLVTKTQMISTVCTGICVNCKHQKTCTYSKTSPRLFCEEYECE